MRDFHKLKVWEKAHQLTLKIYQSTVDFPKEELYGLTSQMRRAASSIPTNIAEGCGRSSKAEITQFFNVANGSAFELEYHLILAHDLKYISDAMFVELTSNLVEVRQMLYAFTQRLKEDMK